MTQRNPCSIVTHLVHCFSAGTGRPGCESTRGSGVAGSEPTNATERALRIRCFDGGSHMLPEAASWSGSDQWTCRQYGRDVLMGLTDMARAAWRASRHHHASVHLD